MILRRFQQMLCPFRISGAEGVFRPKQKLFIQRWQTVSYLLPRKWLAAENRAWPVILDPVVQADLDANNILDRTVAKNKNHSYTWSILDAGYSTTRGKIRSYLQFVNLPTITSSDVVVMAEFSLYKVETSATSYPVEIHKVTDSVTRGRFSCHISG